MLTRTLGALAAACLSTNVLASPGCPSDIDGNHVTNVNDLLAVLNAWGACVAPCGPDLAAPFGSVDVNDLLTLLNGWGACPCQPQNGCVSATAVWCEDFELGNYNRWTGAYPNGTFGCRSSYPATDKFVSPLKSQRSQIFCTSVDSHRGYGGLRFQGDQVVQNYQTNSSGGIIAPNGLVVTQWIWFDAPYAFSPTKWVSLFTVTPDCSNNWNDVITINLDDSTRRLKPVHVSSVTYAPGAPALPLRQWTRITTYVNLSAGQMHIWQNGAKVVSATFSRPTFTYCQWHWGLYASGNNDDVVLFEDSIQILRLNQPLTNFTVEPWVPASLVPCTPALVE